MRHLRRGLWPLKPDSSARHRGPLPSRSFRRRRGSHKAVRRDRHARSGPCWLCSMAKGGATVNREHSVRIRKPVPIMRVWCSGNMPVSKTVRHGFKSCHSCQLRPLLTGRPFSFRQTVNQTATLCRRGYDPQSEQRPDRISRPQTHGQT